MHTLHGGFDLSSLWGAAPPPPSTWDSIKSSLSSAYDKATSGWGSPAPPPPTGWWDSVRTSVGDAYGSASGAISGALGKASGALSGAYDAIASRLGGSLGSFWEGIKNGTTSLFTTTVGGVTQPNWGNIAVAVGVALAVGATGMAVKHSRRRARFAAVLQQYQTQHAVNPDAARKAMVEFARTMSTTEMCDLYNVLEPKVVHDIMLATGMSEELYRSRSLKCQAYIMATKRRSA